MFSSRRRAGKLLVWELVKDSGVRGGCSGAGAGAASTGAGAAGVSAGASSEGGAGSIFREAFCRPCRACPVLGGNPGAEASGYFRPSLRDLGECLVWRNVLIL